MATRERVTHWLDFFADWAGPIRCFGPLPVAVMDALRASTGDSSEEAPSDLLFALETGPIEPQLEPILAATPRGGRAVCWLPAPFAVRDGEIFGPREAEAVAMLARARGWDVEEESTSLPQARLLVLRPPRGKESGAPSRSALPRIAVDPDRSDVSAIVITKGERPSLLEAALASVLAQSAPPREILLVEDGAQDSTRAIAARLGARVRHLVGEESRGQAAAMNRALAASSGALVAWLDDDDRWARTKLARQVEVLRPGIDLVGTAYAIQDEAGETQALAPLPPLDRFPALRLLLHGSLVTGPSLLVRREVYRAVGSYDESFPRVADHEFLSRALRQHRLTMLELPLTWVRRHRGNRRGPEVEAAIRAGVGRVLRSLRDPGLLDAMFPEIAVEGPSALARALLERGGACLRNELWSEAEEDFMGARAALPDAADPLVALGTLRLRLGRSDEAEIDFESARRLAPRRLAPHLGLGLVAAARQRWQAAEAAFAQAIEIDPLHPIARSNLILHRLRVPGLESPLAHELESLVRDLLLRLRPAEMGLSLLELNDPALARPFGL